MRWSERDEKKLIAAINGDATRWQKFWASSWGLALFTFVFTIILVLAVTQ